MAPAPTPPRVFVTRQLPGEALARLAPQVQLEVWPDPLRLPNLLLAPHIASASHQTRGKMASMAVDNLLAALEGRSPPHCVNPELFA